MIFLDEAMVFWSITIVSYRPRIEFKKEIRETFADLGCSKNWTPRFLFKKRNKNLNQSKCRQPVKLSSEIFNGKQLSLLVPVFEFLSILLC